METRAGLEPVVAAVKGLCPNQIRRAGHITAESNLLQAVMLLQYHRQEYHQCEHEELPQAQLDYQLWVTPARSAICKWPVVN